MTDYSRDEAVPMRNVIFLLTKDCMALESLPIYGNGYWETPNIDQLARKGTVFNRHYSAAASTAMSFSAMLTGRYPFEFRKRKFYTAVQPSEFPSIFDLLQQEDYETHLIWDQMWMTMAWPFVREFGNEEKLKLHNLDIAQRTGSGKLDDKPINADEKILERTLGTIKREIERIDYSKKQFVWMHLPHVLKGRRCYMDDIDAFDRVAGFVRDVVDDSCIYITTDHGHMNMHRGKVGYGFDVYEPIIHIPLITPRIGEISTVDFITTNADLSHIILDGVLCKREYVLSDTQYAWQPDRKTAIVTERYKYIYNKRERTEELYDLCWDPHERYNILINEFYDQNRNKYLLYDEYYFYPYRDEALSKLSYFRTIKDSFWFEPSEAQLVTYRMKLRMRRMKILATRFFRNGG